VNCDTVFLKIKFPFLQDEFGSDATYLAVAATLQKCHLKYLFSSDQIYGSK
jgi:hypothetical protein